MKIPNITIEQLLEAGVHLGHKTLRWITIHRKGHNEATKMYAFHYTTCAMLLVVQTSFSEKAR